MLVLPVVELGELVLPVAFTALVLVVELDLSEPEPLIALLALIEPVVGAMSRLDCGVPAGRVAALGRVDAEPIEAAVPPPTRDEHSPVVRHVLDAESKHVARRWV
jgi:hypothetical protein